MSERVVRTELAAVAADVLARATELDVVVMTPGPANGWVFTADALRAGAGVFEGASVFANHADALDRTRAGERRVEDLVGVLSGSRWDPAYRAYRDAGTGAGPWGAVRARLTANGPKGPLVAALASAIVADRAAGRAVPNVGLSADVLVELGPDRKTVTAVRRVFSVDVVFSPARGGKFERVLNAEIAGLEVGERGDNVGDDLVTGGSGAGGNGGVPGTGADRAAAAGDSAAGGAAASSRALLAEIERAREQATQLAQEQLRLACGNLLSTALSASTLPDVLKNEVREQFANRVFPADELTAALKRKDDVYAKLIEGAVIRGMGLPGAGNRIHGMKSSLDRIQAAADMLLGAKVPDDLSDTPRLSGLRELYVMLTGDYDFHGVFHPERVQLAEVDTSSMTSVVKNALNKVLLDSFNMNPKWWAPIAHEEDFATLNDITWMTTGGFTDLPTVAEGDAYLHLHWSDAEETSSFLKKGGYVGISLEMIDRDNVAAVRAIPRKLGLAAYRTVSTLVSNLFTDNTGTGPTLADSEALFSAAHSNLGTDALDGTSWDAAVQAMYKQAEANSAKRMGIRPAYCLAPIELEKTALTLFGSPNQPGTANNDINVRMLANDRVITVPEWTDANNWAAAADPAQAQGVCIGYRFGRVPELFVADQQVGGSAMFTNDEMRIKARFVVAVGIGDYRALYKANVA